MKTELIEKEKIEQWEIDIIRDMAKKQMEIANSEEMAAKEKLWYAHNACETFEPVITLERWTFNKEFAGLFKPKCASGLARRLETYFHNNMVQYEYISDDTVMPKEYTVNIGTWLKAFDIDVVNEQRIGETYAFKIKYEINDLEAEFGKLQKSPFGCNYAQAAEHKANAEEIIGDIMPVRLAFTPSCNLSRYIYNIMGLETMMLAMYDCPGLFHKMMAQISDEFVALWDYMEASNYIRPNNFNVNIPHGTWGFSTELPKNPEKTKKTEGTGSFTMNDVWGHMNSQETSEISPAMFNEFFFPYYKKIGERFGLLTYACCESVSGIWEDSISKFDNLRKLSVSPWCDEEKTGDYLRGKKIIYHRKPAPNYLAVDPVFDKPAFQEHIRKTLSAAKGCYLEFSYRDVYSLQGDKYRAKRAYDTVRECIEKYW